MDIPKPRFVAPPHWGLKTLYTDSLQPTHRVAGHMMIIAFEADPAVVREYVPEPLELDGSGRIFLFNFDGWFYSDRLSQQFISPERYNYTVSYFMVPCDFKGERLHYMLYSWVNRDWLAFRGRQVGMPHKLAKVEMTRFHPVDPVYYDVHEGVRVCVSVQNVGLVLRGHVDLQRRYEPKELPAEGWSTVDHPRHVGWRYVWDVAESRPVLNDLVVHWSDDREIGPIWGGPASLTFHDAENEDVLPFQPRRVIGGWISTLLFHHRVTLPRVLHKFE